MRYSRNHWSYTVSLATVLFLGACGGSDEAGASLEAIRNPTTPIEIAQAIVPFGERQTELVPFPDEMLLAFLACTEDAIGHEVVVNNSGQEPSDPQEAEAIATQDFAASDCALENGLDEYAVMWTPPTQSEMESIRGRWLTAAENCMAEFVDGEIPYQTYEDGSSLPDFDTVFAQDPSLAEPIRLCMRDQGEYLEGDEEPILD